MTTDRDPSTRIVLSWLREDGHENAQRALTHDCAECLCLLREGRDLSKGARALRTGRAYCGLGM
jgi:hypothetical protein